MKKNLLILILMLMAYPHLAFSCRCDFEQLHKITNDPLLAKSSFVAFYKDGFFEVSKNWKPIPSLRLKTESSWPGHSTKCDLNLTNGEEYLVISTNQAQMPFRLDICSTIAVKIKEAKDLLSKLNK